MIHLAKKVVKLSWDLLTPVEPEQILSGNKLFRPLMKYQNAWIKHFYPGDTIKDEINPWVYLQKYMMPLIKKHASSYHLKGIEYLALDKTEKPNFELFQQRFNEISCGFKIEPVTHEITPFDYFTLISQKKFPCIERLRDHNEIFCANEPDFWHEAIGHVAPLCFGEVQSFYLEIAKHLLSARTNSQFKKRLSVAWTLMEYGFIKENDQTKMFGAALVGSHLANMRYLHNYISIAPADQNSIIDSGFHDDDSPKVKGMNGEFLFFCLNNLNTDMLFEE
jgi:phenylalanine-4-hydroxylase